ncbi:hypothetical protein CRG98_035258 [Punica granatum]|uniref:Uncharacterized protein n=1 Tax=Punica granatum TaxID=22663 RepID=A0A2I0IK11_PUNGR|nr:hypothetical protein CRG98_035258 [Punica granatum]
MPPILPITQFSVQVQFLFSAFSSRLPHRRHRRSPRSSRRLGPPLPSTRSPCLLRLHQNPYFPLFNSHRRAPCFRQRRPLSCRLLQLQSSLSWHCLLASHTHTRDLNSQSVSTEPLSTFYPFGHQKLCLREDQAIDRQLSLSGQVLGGASVGGSLSFSSRTPVAGF